ncbi:hypothetical protein [Mesorhizobium sp. L48C026A00]|uniref:hypothetical protein n=1 Tax=Mesorhizobium sp. L48C026A00 TaxID=1287182 RepID=UPI0003D047AC|nr:hypothetical protein [Mesorhizobium sp. L48C026A00]ESZ10599.1 hypothetical protein X737_31105 [Mesorhizobium sp. L48C026A00]
MLPTPCAIIDAKRRSCRRRRSVRLPAGSSVRFIDGGFQRRYELAEKWIDDVVEMAPTRFDLPVRSLAAEASRMKPMATAASSTRFFVAAETRPVPDNIQDTVATNKPAAAATSLILSLHVLSC